MFDSCRWLRRHSETARALYGHTFRDRLPDTLPMAYMDDMGDHQIAAVPVCLGVVVAGFDYHPVTCSKGKLNISINEIDMRRCGKGSQFPLVTSFLPSSSSGAPSPPHSLV